MTSQVRIDHAEGGVATVTVTRAEIGNASTPEMLGAVRDAFLEVSELAEVRAVVLAAEGKHFSVGADFAFLQRLTGMGPAEIRGTVYANFQGAAKAIYRCPKPTLALVQGAAITVGCEIALACDFRLAADTARFQESWIRLGIMPPLGGLFLLPRLVGMGRAMEICLQGRPVLAEEAARIGLVSEVVAADALAEAGMAKARELAALPPTAYASAKQAMQRGLESTMEAEWQANVATQAVLLASEDFREGLAAVTEKRAPRFTGR